MTKKIMWRLKEVPTSESLRELVKDGILNKDEAREILFSQEEQTDRTKESLEQEIKFLRELIDKLSTRQKVVEIIREVEKPYRIYPWYSPYATWTTENITTTPGYLYTDDNKHLCSFSSINTF
jgi:hypothetical protein